MRAPLRFAAHAAALALSVPGCAGTRGAAPVDRAGCVELPEAKVPGAFAFALSGPVDPAHAPLPANPAEAVVFRLLYETLTDVDCLGQVLPGLAESWKVSADSLSWTFRLREDAPRVGADAGAVLDSWGENRRVARREETPAWPWGIVRLRSVHASDPYRLEITTSAPQPELPALLCLPEFAVALRGSGEDDASPWPEGTRGRIRDPESEAPERGLVFEPTSGEGSVPGGAVTFDVRPGADPRDLASSAADAFLAGEHGAFLAGLADWIVSPLPPSREYWLVTAHAALGDSLAAEAAGTDWTTAVHTPAVPLLLPTFGDATDDEAPLEGEVVVLHSLDDADAAALAARIVAASGSAVSEGVDADLFPRRLARGEGAAFVVALRPPPAESLRPFQLRSLAPWVRRGRAIPLVATRDALVTRAGLGGIEAGHDGVPRLDGTGWSAETTP